ncbi:MULTISPECIES: SNF2-related protein [unclassified Rhodococcus (in: high G+C Gram-positive bacteria)]|uniref:SNF2-related protein n=1 Tax=unclassified Rhodococcus (in: high G+C Gram-positive bacteria) TaxID=192944 RepID=UPI0007BC3615|nr:MULTISPECIES: SNF2-related protein [unclassified Rhodococcus (in: high G+C Gram-positive bacteria)]KZF09463.1 DNA helicase [Rhodococcus sp. EPR-147]KZF11774.1 DNA helicase [Rhodococcus sp. EPR-279]
MTLNAYQAKYYAYELQRAYANDHVGKLAGILFDAQVEPKPHQIDAALFALQTPYLNGVILADEVGLGKTIEAGIVVTQFWSERKRRILIIAPSSLRQQWQQELLEKFLIPSQLLSPTSKGEQLGLTNREGTEVLICSYEFALRHETSLLRPWDLVICDEAHRLRNFYTGRNKAPEAISHIVREAQKTILLTATPLQNRLEELYGLVSVFDPDYFYSLEAFRERYVKVKGIGDNDDLVERVAGISKRTLRRDAARYIHFTKRMPLTVEFMPSSAELELYDKVNDYLQREVLYAFSNSQRHLTALILRKRLGSSTYAVSSTLERIADRLEAEVRSGVRRDSRGGLILADFAEADLTDEELESIEAGGLPTPDGGPAVDEGLNHDVLEAMRAEVFELRRYAALASSITVNQKAVKLGEALDKGFERLKELGAPQKAIIFTDSTKTQQYIARTLTESGRGDGLVLFNGTNTSPASNEIYRDWLEANKDGEIITGIASADRRKALVDYFRDRGKVMIATEAAAEGINLQFCSMLVNYDLPWNPQRVEQRIGRVHRFGQKFDVVVANFSNKGNAAEARILELLANKFHLFKGVFGASDEVLGSIEDGFDFEKTINRILSDSRSDADINRAFEDLEKTYATEISSEMAAAKAKVFDNLDPNVQDRLKSYDAQSGEVLNKFERLLLAITKRQLADHADFEGDGRQFVLRESPVEDAPRGRYYFKSEPLDNAHQYRFSGPLAGYVIESAKTSDTPAKELTFSLGQSERVTTAVKDLVGKSGELTVKVVTFSMKAKNDDISESYMLAGGLTDDGQWLDHEYAADILDLACTDEGAEVAINDAVFEQHLAERRNQLEREVQGRNSRYYDQQEELLYRNQQDRRAESDGQIREYKAKEKEARKSARSTDDPMQQLRFKKDARKWAERAEEKDEEARVARRKMREEADLYLELIEQALRGTQAIEHLFSIRWKVVT